MVVSSFDVDRIRADFPILHQEVNGQPLVYLDNAATSFPKAPGVAQAVYDYISRIGANAGRASYKNARKASGLLFETRENLAAILGVSDDAQETLGTAAA